MALYSVETLARMQESMAFQAAYARDQRSAVAQYAYLLTDADNNASHFYTSLKYEGGQWTVREQPEAQYKLRYRTYSSESNKPNIMDFF